MTTNLDARWLLDHGYSYRDRSEIKENYNLTDEQTDEVVKAMQNVVIADHFAGKVQCFVDNGGGIHMISGVGASYNVITHLEQTRRATGIFDIANSQDWDIYGDAYEIREFLLDYAGYLDDPMGGLYVVAEYRPDSGIELYTNVMVGSERAYFGIDSDWYK